MTNKVELNTLTQVVHKEQAFLTALNENFLRVQQAINDTISRTGVVPNQMEEVLDMNGKRIVNTGKAVEDADVVTKEYIDELIDEVESAVERAESLVTDAQNAIEVYAQEHIYPVAQAALDGAVAAKDLAKGYADDAKDYYDDTKDLYDQLEGLKNSLNELLEVYSHLSDITTVCNNIQDVEDCADNMTAIQAAPTAASNAANSALAAAESAALSAQYANDKINQTHITNCIIDIPQNLKIELDSDGVLTLKAGSIATLADDSTITTTADITGTRSSRQECLVFLKNTTLTFMPLEYCHAGTTAPSASQYMFWLDTANKKVKYTNNSGSTWSEGFSLPICKTVSYDGKIQRIEHIFNGFGFIGAAYFILPNVKCLSTDGFNPDGTFKNAEYKFTKVVTGTRGSIVKDMIVVCRGTNSTLAGVHYKSVDYLPSDPSSGDIVYIPSKNKHFRYVNSAWSEEKACLLFKFDKVTAGDTGISNFVAREVFSTNDVNFAVSQSSAGSSFRFLNDRFSDILSVKDFGAIGDGITDDTDAINKALAYIRSNVSTTNHSFMLDLCGGSYRVTGSLNATLINSWDWGIKNGTLLGFCTGKAVLDLTGSRGYHLSDLYIKGDKTSTPRVGLQCARSLESLHAFCDNNLFENVNIDGYFTLAAIYTYGQESTTYLKCQYWNRYVGGYAAIHTGKDFETYQSDFTTHVTGNTSFINDKYINCDYRLLPTQASITNITRANPCVVTVSDASDFSVGDKITFTFIEGMTELNEKSFTISAISGNNITINTDSSGYTAYSSSGYAIKGHTKATILLGRMSQHFFDHCYVVNYCGSAIEFRADDQYPKTEDLVLDFLFEGSGVYSLLNINSSVDFTFVQSLIKTYGSWFENYMISQTGSQTIFFKGSKIDWGSTFKNNPSLFDTSSNYHLYGVELNIPNSNMYDYSHYYGVTYTYNTNAPVLKKVEYDQTDMGAFTPTVTPATGSIETYTASGYAYRYGKMVFVQIQINITDNGTGAASLLVSGIPGLPAAEECYLTGRENAATGKQLIGRCQRGISNCVVRTYDNAYPGATGAVLNLSGVIITA